MGQVHYRGITERVLEGLEIKLSEEKLDFIVQRLESVNKMVEYANDNQEGHDLRSTQVISSIIFDCLTEMKLY